MLRTAMVLAFVGGRDPIGLLLLLLGVLQSPLLSAQTQVAEPVPAFDVASVKPNRSGERTGPYFRYEGSGEVLVIDSAERPTPD